MTAYLSDILGFLNRLNLHYFEAREKLESTIQTQKTFEKIKQTLPQAE